MAIHQVTTTNAVSGAQNQKTSTGSGADFKAVFQSKITTMKEEFKQTGMTAADLALWKAGGDRALEAKAELKEQQKAAEDKSTDASSTSTTASVKIQVIRKFMPDGSLLVLKTKGNEVIDQYRKKPRLTTKPDFSRPPKPGADGMERPQTKQVPKQDIFEMMM